MDEESVIQRCQQGDLMAYRMIYDRYEQPFLRTAFRMLWRQQEAELAKGGATVYIETNGSISIKSSRITIKEK